MRSFIALSALALAACTAETSSPAIPGRLEVVMGGAQVGVPARSLDTLVGIRLVDDRGDPIPGATIHWEVTGGGGRLDEAGATTGTDGVATARWIVGATPGPQRLHVSASGVDAIEVGAEARGLQGLAVAVTQEAVCVVDTAHVTRCWGSFGQTGPAQFYEYGDTPVVVDSARRFTALTGGWDHMCALAETGTAWCWGIHHNGQLGTGAGAAPSIHPQQVAGGHTFTAIAAAERTTCALDGAGQAWCWGSPGDGSLGTGNVTELTPAAVQQGSAVFTAISLGSEHICALDSNAEAWCWGHQDVGQLGDSSSTAQAFPAKVAGGRRFATITAGDHFTCATGSDRSVWCWGAPPLTPFREYQVPVPVGPTGVTTLVAGDEYLVGIQAGRPVAAGAAWYIGVPPEIGGGTLTEMPGGLFSIQQIAMRWANICMVRSDHQVFCVGEVPGFGTTATPVGIPAP
jgi:hypothetical protein